MNWAEGYEHPMLTHFCSTEALALLYQPHREGRDFCLAAITLKQEMGRGWETPIRISEFGAAFS